MFDIVMYGREKHKVVERIPSLGLVYFSDGEAAPAKAVKPVIRLTPLVRAEMLIEAVKGYVGKGVCWRHDPRRSAPDGGLGTNGPLF